MSTAEMRRKISELNKALRSQYTELKIKKENLSEHIETLIRRTKQMDALKKTLEEDLMRAQLTAKADRNQKIAYIGVLEGELSKLNQDYAAQSIVIKKYEDQYELCLQDYDATLKAITADIEGVKILESDILQEKQGQASMKAIIFDYEKLKRVLEEEKNYLKELSSSEQKSHEERMKELQKMKAKLLQEAQSHQGSFMLVRQKSGFAKLHKLYCRRLRVYGEHFLRGQLKLKYKTDLGIKIFKNCLELGSLKHKLSTRKLFYKWHHNVFSKTILSNLVENAFHQNIDSKKKISIMNTMTEKTNEQNLYLFHLFEKGKFVSTLAQKIGRKDMAYGFNKWRESYHKQAKQFNKLNILFSKTLPNFQKRWTFKVWKNNSFVEKRIERANYLLEEYINTKELSRIFRKWRLQIPTLEINYINFYIRNIKDRNLIASRINYEKRKTKALSILSQRMTKIKLRNYFIKYWGNVKDYRVNGLRDNIIGQKDKFTELRAENKKVVTTANKQNRIKSLKIFRKFMFNLKIRPVFRKWRNINKVLHSRSEAIFHIALKREAKAKIYVMNEFRRCVQYYEKKQMHQVLTDLNNKMEAINEKSTDFRNRLKKCVQQLGVTASKKLEYIFGYSIKCQQRVYFRTYITKQVKRLYNEYILYRLGVVVNKFYTKESLNRIQLFAKNQYKEKKLKQAQEKFEKFKNKMILERSFYAMKGAVKKNKQCFKRMIKSQNVLMFYRMASGFLALQRKACAETIKATHKKIASNRQILVTRNQNLENLESRRQKLEVALKKIFSNFVSFQSRNMDLKDNQLKDKLIKRYFNLYRANTVRISHIQKTLLHFEGFLRQKNNMIFWKSVTAIKYENSIALVKEQLGQVNRKKKAFQEKNTKGRGDIEKRLDEAIDIYQEKKENHDYFANKYENTLEFYVRKHAKTEKMHYLREIFGIWKKEYLGAKRIYHGINRIYQRNFVHPSFQQIVRIMKKEDSQFKSQLLCADILFRKARNCMKDCIILWRCNLRQLKCEKMEHKVIEMMKERDALVSQSKITGELISNQRLRLKHHKVLSTCFMAFKTDLTENIYLEKYQIEPMNQKINQRLKRTVINGWKWLMHYKKTKRSYLKYKKEKIERELKSDVFQSLKIYREEHYHLVEKMNNITLNLTQQFTRYALDKVINVAAHERDELTYARRRALREIVMEKVTRVQLIKKKIMAKWHAWLIPKNHYLPVIIKNCEINTLKRAFANIREKAYWHPVYVRDAADKITNEGYTQINNATNNLVKEGFDPDQIKDYLSEKNEEDNKIIRRVVKRMEVWGQRQDMVRAWNSWKQYLQIKRKIRKSMSKVMMIAQGIGRYWNRWKKKDPQFNAILQKESRGNMLERYRDLGRLLKEYRRDVKDSKVYCQELKEINDEYSEKNDEGIRMALTVFSSKLKVGLRQGLDIWRKRVREFHNAETDRKYDQLSSGIQMLLNRKKTMRERIALLKQENNAMKQKCNLGAQCGTILQNLLKEKDNLSIDLADKEHNLKLLLEDNLRLKQKIRAAKVNAEKLINRVQDIKENQQ